MHTQGPLELSPPCGDLHVAFGKNLLNYFPKGFGNRRVGNVAFVLIGFSRDKRAMLSHHRLIELSDQRGLSNTRITGDEYEFRTALFHDPVKGAQKSANITLPTVEFLRNQQPIGYIPFSEDKRLDAVLGLPLRLTSSPGRFSDRTLFDSALRRSWREASSRYRRPPAGWSE